MSDAPSQHDHDREIGPEDGSADRRASELVIGGLLSALHHRNEPARQRRIDRVLTAVDHERLSRSRLRFPRAARWSLSIAALLAISTLVMLFGVPGESRVMADMNKAIAALKQPGDRRYEVLLSVGTLAEPRFRLGAVIDMRAPDLLVVQHWPPWVDRTICVGRDASGPWAIDSEGRVSREDAYRAWPPWSADGETLFVDSLDRLLQLLPKRYDLSSGADEPVDGAAADKLYRRVSASRRDRAGPFPHRVEVWIDRATSLVERVEFRWDTEFVGRHRGGFGPPPGHDHGPRQERHDHGTGGRDPAKMDESPGHRHQHDHPPDRRPPADVGDGERPPRPDHDHGDARPGFGHRDGHVGRPTGMRGGGPPPGGLRLMIFQRVDPPELGERWFDPESHAGD